MWKRFKYRLVLQVPSRVKFFFFFYRDVSLDMVDDTQQMMLENIAAENALSIKPASLQESLFCRAL